MDDPQQPPLAPPKVTALKLGASNPHKAPMERTVSQNIRDEMQELKEAAEQTLNVLVDLNLDGTIRSVSPSWREVVGSDPESVIGKPIDDMLAGNKRAFTDVVDNMRQDDARSRVIRFSMKMGPFSKLRTKPGPPEASSGEPVEASRPEEESEQILNLEAQGIMSYNPASGDDCHTMWMMRPSVVREVTIDLPEILVESLGVGAEVLARYLTELAEAGAGDPSTHPPPPPVLCRICERHITPWWFEKHTDLCLQEHKAEMEVQMAQEALTDHRNAIVKVLDALEASSQRQTRAAAGDANQPIATGPPAEYKGLAISPASTPSSGVSSGRASPASPPSRSRDRSAGLGHRRARSFAVRRPLSRIVELVLDLCDTALEINTPAIKDTRGQLSTELRTQSPQSENRISQVLQWQSPNMGANEGEQGLSALCEDTARYCRAKVDAIFRYRRILEYSERIRVEFEVLVQECVEAAISKAASIARGELSDSTDTSDTASQPDETPTEVDPPDCQQEEGMFSCSLENPSAMSQAFRNSSEISLASSSHLDRRPSSAATSTRSSSPRGSQTPRSHVGAVNIASHSKRTSMHLESDAGADSDSSVRSSVLSGPRRADSPGSEVSLSRVASSRERKRRSLILPSVMSSRQQSPARAGMQPPPSPLRMKGRISIGPDGIHSPITSPVLSTSDFSSPALAAYPIHHHRRQSSTAGSDIAKPPVSPRLIPSSNPQPRAVPPSIKDFEIIKPISKGAFGSVYLSKKKSTGDYFAIKVLKKADMVAKNQVTNVKAERAIMMWQGESDFVAKLYWTFSSKDYLYLVMEYLNGGDCASLIKVLGALPEDWAKKYLAEVVLGVEHLHSRGIVHRDLKPDNLLIDQKGHLKLTDFGLSRMGLIGRQKRALNSKSDEQAPDLLKGGPFHRALSVTSSRSASFDAQGNQHSPQHTPSLMPALSGDLNQPSYFSLSKEPARELSRRTSNNRSDSGDSDALQNMFRRFSIADDAVSGQRRSPIDEEVYMSEDGGSPDPYGLHPTISHSSAAHNATPPQNSGMLPPPLALFDPEDSDRRFVGTPDYLAPETINGSGQDEVSDWWSLGCILFECLYGYPPFHAETPDEVFKNILERKIDWPPEDEYEVSEEATDLMNRLMCTDPTKRLGANIGDKFSCGGEEIKAHPWFADTNWDSLRDDEASFVPASENPEDTEYFDARGATMQNFAAEFEDQAVSSSGTPGADYHDRPHDALSRVRSQVQVNSVKRSLMPLHIPPHVREGRSRRLSEPMATDDFGAFAFKNLPVLEKANKDVIQKLRAEAMQAQSKPPSTATSPSVTSPTPSLESSPMVPMPLKRTHSTTGKGGRPASPSVSQVSSSPSRASQPSSPLLVSFSTGQNHERRKTSSGTSSLSHQPSNTSTTSSSLQPGSFFEAKLAGKPVKTPGVPVPVEKSAISQARQNSLPPGAVSSPRARSQTLDSQDGELAVSQAKRRSQVLDVSPSSSDTEESRQKALLRVHRRRQSSRRMSHIAADGPYFRPLDILICEDHPVSRLVMEKLLEKLRCRAIKVQTGPEAMRYAMSEVKFDIIMMEYRLPQVNGADVARMIRETKNANSHTPIVAVTGYLKELQAPHHFDALIEKPPTIAKLTEVIGRLCQWKSPPPNWTPSMLTSVVPSNLRQETSRVEDSPISNSSSFAAMPSGSYRGSSREDSISSSFFGDNDNKNDEVAVVIDRQSTDEWRDRDMAHAFGGLGISDEPKESKSLLAIPTSVPLRQEASAPAAMEHTPHTPVRKQRSSEQINAKRRSMENKKHESAESGDDEDEELGDAQVRTKSPKGRTRGSSKLGLEMMRTNSHGSVVSVEEMAAVDSLSASPPPVISEEQSVDDSQVEAAPVTPAKAGGDETDRPEQASLSITPPEMLPHLPGNAVKEIEMDTEATPKAPHTEPDPDPTPKASTSPSRS
ncbi:agc protein kinase [Diplodia corticola]|uniref:non-specific serine/threonine protein kinase n=1 Tax=Diplodia corticola TaxID=236234 RepID=A0A1J9QN00_9PEZI|nr:agc protein kinase [Diplodia corticola]OJD29849.1 agc protein kinase [Diplodia corticola]